MPPRPNIESGHSSTSSDPTAKEPQITSAGGAYSTSSLRGSCQYRSAGRHLFRWSPSRAVTASTAAATPSSTARRTGSRSRTHVSTRPAAPTSNANNPKGKVDAKQSAGRDLPVDRLHPALPGGLCGSAFVTDPTAQIALVGGVEPDRDQYGAVSRRRLH
jgi:hypothetical protein